jgi:hypothetical protein
MIAIALAVPCLAALPDTAGAVGEAVAWARARRMLHAYAEKAGLKSADLEEAKLELLPNSRVFRYRIPGEDVPQAHLFGKAERFGVLFVDRKGDIVELRNRTPGKDFEALLAKLKERGVKVRNVQEAKTVLSALVTLDTWIDSVQPPRRDPREMRVRESYRGLPNSYGAVFPWSGGDDVGIQLDGEGFVRRMLGGHIR